MASDSVSGDLAAQLPAAFQAATQGQWPAAIETVRPFADEGDPVAQALVAFWLGNSGQAAQGVEYAKAAIHAGIAAGPLAINYVNWTQGDAALRGESANFFKAAVESGWTVDPISQAQQAFQLGDVASALSILTTRAAPSAEQAAESWRSVAEQIESASGRIAALMGEADAARRRAEASMTSDSEAITAERDRVLALVGETTALVQNVASNELASEYAQRASDARKRGARWTAATLVVSSVAILLAAAFVLVGLSDDHDPADVLSKAALSLPLLALAAYLNRLGSEERRDARNWTHVELQIRTARPYVGNLAEGLRDEVQAALALRFFPGQSQDPHGPSAAPDGNAALSFVQGVRQSPTDSKAPQ